jgi:hypothetical protein
MGAPLPTGLCPQRTCFRPLAAVYRFRHGGRAFAAANLLEMQNERQAVELHNWHCQKQIDATLHHAEGFIEGDRDFGLAAGRRARLGNAPMGGDWLARPGRTRFTGDIIADDEHEMEIGSMGAREVQRGFRAQIVDIVTFVVQQRDRMTMEFTIRIGPAAEGAEVPRTMTIEDCLGP